MEMTKWVTIALQLAISFRRDNKTVDEVKAECRNRHWREYTAEVKATIERTIDNYFKQPAASMFTGPKVVEEVHPQRIEVLAIIGNPKNYTKDDLVALAERIGIKVKKSMAKANMVKALDEATLPQKVA
jgi:hypothetical protein